MQWSLHRYELPLKFCKESRKGAILKIEKDTGEIGWGEIAPLPGWSQENLDDACKQAEKFLKKKTSSEPLYPSVSFAIESALSPHQPSSHPVAALLMGNEKEILKKADKIIKQGYTTAKLKVAGMATETAAELIKELKDKLKLRIDVNRAWNLKQSLDFFSAFSADDFEYIEEPVNDLKALPFFTHPFALDETLRELTFDKIPKLPLLKAFIFKPTLMGGYSVCRKLMSLGKEIVLSAAFESGIGIAQIASFVSELNLPTHPLGIDTYTYLKRDLLEQPLDFSKGILDVPHALSYSNSNG